MLCLFVQCMGFPGEGPGAEERQLVHGRQRQGEYCRNCGKISTIGSSGQPLKGYRLAGEEKGANHWCSKKCFVEDEKRTVSAIVEAHETGQEAADVYQRALEEVAAMADAGARARSEQDDLVRG